MIDIIGHFFILYPAITFNKDSPLFGRSILQKTLVNMAILLVAFGLTNVYLMDSSLVKRDRDA